jgi:hypothetical protein
MKYTSANLEALRTLVVMFGPREAARQCGMKEDTVCGIAWRKKWKKASAPEQTQSPAPIPNTQSAISNPQQVIPDAVPLSKKGQAIINQPPSTAVSSALSSLRGRSMLGLARYSARAAELAAEHKDPLEISRKAKDVSDVHKALWPVENQNQNILQIGILIGNESAE